MLESITVKSEIRNSIKFKTKRDHVLILCNFISHITTTKNDTDAPHYPYFRYLPQFKRRERDKHNKKQVSFST